MSSSVAECPRRVGFDQFITLSSLDISQATAAFLERRIMKKLNKVAVLLCIALAASAASAVRRS